jgi:hypothetical protein
MAFDLTKPSIGDADWPTFAANIRENLRAIVEGDAGVYTKTTDITLQITTTGTSTFARVATRSGNGTTSGRKSYFRAETLETTPQVWHLGMLGDKNFGIRDETAAVTRLIIDQATGRVGIGIAPTKTLHVNGEIRSDSNSIAVYGPSPSSAGFSIYNASAVQHWLIYQNIGAAGEQGTLNFRNMVAARTDITIGTDGEVLLGVNRLSVKANGNVVMGTAALATNATDGFFYLDSCAGTPTGTPTAFTGRVPFIYDTTNNKLYAYNGAWKQVTLA